MKEVSFQKSVWQGLLEIEYSLIPASKNCENQWFKGWLSLYTSQVTRQIYKKLKGFGSTNFTAIF